MTSRPIVANGIRYTASIGRSVLEKKQRGFSGEQWTVYFFFDGAVLHTEDLRWHHVARGEQNTAVILRGWIHRDAVPRLAVMPAGNGAEIYGPLRAESVPDTPERPYNLNAGRTKRAGRRHPMRERP